MRALKMIMNKEFARVFKDKKMIFSLFILPVIMVVFIIALIALIAYFIIGDQTKHVSQIYVVNEPAAFAEMLEDGESTVINYADESMIEDIKSDILDMRADVLVVFPKTFEEDVAADKVPDVRTYYNPSNDYYDVSYLYISKALSEYRNYLIIEKFGSVEKTLVFTENATDGELEGDDSVIQDDKVASGKMIGAFLPYFITVLLFAGAMSLGVDAFTGEKERGTLAALLMTPAKRIEIAFGKIIGLTLLSLASACVYLIILLVIMLVGGSFAARLDLGISLAFNAGQYLRVFVLVFGLVFLYVSVIALVSIHAKTVKEAQSYISPIYIVVMVFGLINMYNNSSPSTFVYLIPIYNVGIAFKGIFTQDITAVQYLLSVFSTFGFAAFFTYLVAKAFKSEKVVFSN